MARNMNIATGVHVSWDCVVACCAFHLDLSPRCVPISNDAWHVVHLRPKLIWICCYRCRYMARSQSPLSQRAPAGAPVSAEGMVPIAKTNV